MMKTTVFSLQDKDGKTDEEQSVCSLQKFMKEAETLNFWQLFTTALKTDNYADILENSNSYLSYVVR